MKHLVCFAESVAANQTNEQIMPVSDGVISAPGPGFTIPERMQVRKALICGLGVTEGRLNVPGLRKIALPRTYPVNKALLPVDRPPFIDWGDYGPILRPTENLSLELTTDGTAGPNLSRGLLWLGDNLPAAPKGDVFTLKYTGTPTAVDNAWVNFTPTPETALPAGRYALIGADAFGTGLFAARFQFPGQTYRPGIVCQQAAGEFDDGSQRFGRLGKFGEFLSTALPTVDILAPAGAVTVTMYWDLVQVGSFQQL